MSCTRTCGSMGGSTGALGLGGRLGIAGLPFLQFIEGGWLAGDWKWTEKLGLV